MRKDAMPNRIVLRGGGSRNKADPVLPHCLTRAFASEGGCIHPPYVVQCFVGCRVDVFKPGGGEAVAEPANLRVPGSTAAVVGGPAAASSKSGGWKGSVVGGGDAVATCGSTVSGAENSEVVSMSRRLFRLRWQRRAGSGSGAGNEEVHPQAPRPPRGSQSLVNLP